MKVRRVAIFVTMIAGMFLVVSQIAGKAGPSMRERCSEMCDRFLDEMPESFPPNRMLADLETLKERTARILEMLEKSGEAEATEG